MLIIPSCNCFLNNNISIIHSMMPAASCMNASDSHGFAFVGLSMHMFYDEQSNTFYITTVGIVKCFIMIQEINIPSALSYV